MNLVTNPQSIRKAPYTFFVKIRCRFSANFSKADEESIFIRSNVLPRTK